METILLTGGIVLAIFVIYAFVVQGENKDKIKKALQAVDDSGLEIDRSIQGIAGHLLSIDDTNKKISIINDRGSTTVSYDKVISFELEEDGHSVVQGRMGAAALGGLAFGAVGAAVGASGGRQVKNTASSIVLRIFLDDLHHPQTYITFLSAAVPKDGPVYKGCIELAKEAIGVMTYIHNQLHQKAGDEVQ